IDLPVAVHILPRRLQRSSTLRTECDRRFVYPCGIEGVCGKERDGDFSVAPRVDAVGVTAGLDIDRDRSYCGEPQRRMKLGIADDSAGADNPADIIPGRGVAGAAAEGTEVHHPPRRRPPKRMRTGVARRIAPPDDLAPVLHV